jgi:hypothetical protein
MTMLLVFMFGFAAGALLTRRSVWKVIEGKAKFSVVPKEEANAKTQGK